MEALNLLLNLLLAMLVLWAARAVVLIVPLILDGVARMIDFLQTRVTSLARAMKEGAAEVDAYWQRVREGGENCHTASS